MKLILCALLAIPALACADSVTAPPQAAGPRFLQVEATPDNPLSLTPDRADRTYGLDAPASIFVKVARAPYPAGGIALRYRLGPDMREGPERMLLVPAEGIALPVPAQAAAGFVRLIVRGEIDGKKVGAMATLGFAPEKIVASAVDPDDFDAYWDKQRAALAQIAPEWTLTPAPDLSTDAVEVSYLRFQNVGNWAGPSHFYGVLSVPRGPGPFPALLEVPGAGVRGYAGARQLAAKGMITLQVGIHGIPLNLPRDVYEDLARGALGEYNRYQIDDRDNYYYRRVHLGVLRAADYLARHPKWDQRRLLVSGGSQGGQLAIMTAALERRVSALAAGFPAYSDVAAYLSGGTGGWPHLFKPGADGKPGDAPVEAKLLTSRYYDSANFARRLRVPGFYTWGYNDTVTPPTSTFAVYNLIRAPKQLLVAPDQTHATSTSQQREIETFILDRAGLAPSLNNPTNMGPTP